MDPVSVCARPVLRRDAQALIGVLATLEALAMVSQLDADLVDRLSRRFASLGLMAEGGTEREFRQALADLNQRMRYALGEYDDPPQSLPVP
ncbi:hypothetical protein [Blastococcus sp. TF02-09]|uniref:hypothetical protein n=1 Tax=Blastococcus sp. TF02-09 TaxID=2250576 RepID=UPI0011BF35BD|nr:hypothetical protein [Blastococcus sp. TF02-9]